MVKTRGFTLIELSVTVAVLVIISAMVVPGFTRIKQQNAARDLMPSMMRLMAAAREGAINQGVPLVVSFDSQTNSLQIASDDYQNQNLPQPADGVKAPASGTPQNGTSAPAPTSGLQFPGQAMRTQALPEGASTESFQLAGKDSSESEFKLRFYPDGTCDGGGITFRTGNNEQSISVDKLGAAKLTDGPLPDATTTLWEAGQLAQRTS
jgi:type IV fimbrial biogenesis protein FimT